MSSNRNYRIGEVAEIFQVAPNTISKWFKKEMLKGHKIPGTDNYHRRFLREDILKFMKDYGIPILLNRAYTTGEAAKICKVPQKIIIDQFDRGNIRGYRLPNLECYPQKGHRRIIYHGLEEFIRATPGMELDWMKEFNSENPA